MRCTSYSVYFLFDVLRCRRISDGRVSYNNDRVLGKIGVPDYGAEWANGPSLARKRSVKWNATLICFYCR